MKQFIHSYGDSSFLITSFCIIVFVALLMEIFILRRQKKSMTVSMALMQTAAWIALGLSYGYLLYTDDGEKGLQFFSAYLTEYSLSADNLFVFILIFSSFSISERFVPRVLLIGIIGAILLRIIFIVIGIGIVNEFHWILYIFGAILVYTGFSIFFSNEEKEFDPKKNLVYRWMSKTFPLVADQGNGKFIVRRQGKKFYTRLFLVVAIIASTDVVFAIDSIPAVFAISQDRLVVITSNIMAVMGLRSLFFLLKGVADRFDFLQQGIAFILVFIGVKMLLEIFNILIPTSWSLAIIGGALFLAILISVFFDKKKNKLAE